MPKVSDIMYYRLEKKEVPRSFVHLILIQVHVIPYISTRIKVAKKTLDSFDMLAKDMK